MTTLTSRAPPRKADSLRHYCRYERCKSRLPSPVEHPARAFCSKHCRVAFFKKRCIVCEDYAPRTTCSAKKCQSEYRRFKHVFELDRTSRPLPYGDVSRRSQKCPENGPLNPPIIGPEDAPTTLLGGYRFEQAPKLDPALRLTILATERMLTCGGKRKTPSTRPRVAPLRMAAASLKRAPHFPQGEAQKAHNMERELSPQPRKS
jgi:hypothetical protein